MAQKKCWDMNIPILFVVQSFLIVQLTKKYFKKAHLGEMECDARRFGNIMKKSVCREVKEIA